MLAVDAPSPPSAISRTAASRIAPRFSGLLTRAIALTRLQAPAPSSISQNFPQKYFKTMACFRHHENTTQITTFYHPKPTTSPQKTINFLPYFAKPHAKTSPRKLPSFTQPSRQPLRQSRHQNPSLCRLHVIRNPVVLHHSRLRIIHN